MEIYIRPLRVARHEFKRCWHREPEKERERERAREREREREREIESARERDRERRDSVFQTQGSHLLTTTPGALLRLPPLGIPYTVAGSVLKKVSLRCATVFESGPLMS